MLQVRLLNNLLFQFGISLTIIVNELILYKGDKNKLSKKISHVYGIFSPFY